MSRKSFAWVAVAAAVGWTTPALAADHLDSPSVQAEQAADINDFYAFVTPGDDDTITLVMTVFPLAGANAAFSDAVVYSFNVLRLADGTALTIDCTFEEDGSYDCRAPSGVSATGTVGGGTAMGDSIRTWAGLRDDPFFFDLQAFQVTTGAAEEGEPFCILDPEDDTGADFFAGLNVLALVVEIRDEVLTQGLEDDVRLGIWASTARRGG